MPPRPKSPIPPDSPLLSRHKSRSPTPASPTMQRARVFNKDLRKARSFRGSRER